MIPYIVTVMNNGGIGSLDPDVSDFQSRVIAAGGTLSNTELSGINAAVNLLKQSGVWSKITDLAPLVGGFNGCYVKLKYSNAAIKSMVSDGTANFSSGDYNIATGLTSLTTTKRLQIGCIPTSAGLSNTNLNITYLCNAGVLSAGAKLIISDRQTPSYAIDLQTTASRLNNGAVIVNNSLDLNLDATIRALFTSVNLGSITNVYNDFKNLTTNAQSSPSMTLNQDLYLFHNGTSYFNGNIGCVVVSQSLTSAEYFQLYGALLTFYRSIGRISAATASDYFFGDSITFGTAATSTNLRYSYLRSVADSRREINSGITASPLMTNGSYREPAGFFRRSEIIRYAQDNPGSTFHILYGVNDIVLNSNTGYATYTLMLQWLCEDIIPAGGTVKLSSITLLNTGSATLRTNYRAGSLLVAKIEQVLYVDMDSYMSANGGVSLLSDNIHPTNSGHSVISTGWGTAAIPARDGTVKHWSLFQGSNGSDITTYTPKVGNPWASINSGQWQFTQDTGGQMPPYYVSSVGTAPSNNWQVESDIAATDCTAYFWAYKTGPNDLARFVVKKTDANNYVELRWTTSNALQFWNVVSGVATQFGSISATPTQSVPHLFKIIVSGTSISIEVDFSGSPTSGTIPSVQNGTKIGFGQGTATAGTVRFYQVYAHL